MRTSGKSVLLALAVFVFILSAGGSHINNFIESNVKVIADVSDENNEALPRQASLSIDIFNSVIQVSHLIFHSDFVLEFNLPEIDETKAHSVFDTALNFIKYFRTLFRTIISPNAP